MNFYSFSVLRWSAARCIQLDSSNRRQNVIVSVIDSSVWSVSLQLRAVLMRQTFSSCALCKQICSNDRKSRMICSPYAPCLILHLILQFFLEKRQRPPLWGHRAACVKILRCVLHYGCLVDYSGLVNYSAASVLGFCVSGSVLDFHLIKADFFKIKFVSVFVIQDLKPADSLRWAKTIIVD